MDQADSDEEITEEHVTRLLDEYRKAMIEAIDNEELDGLDDWREACREHSQDNPNEAYEWWLVSNWLCQKLRDIGEIVLDNGHGCWWGRGCTGQAMIMDGTLQRIAENTERSIAESLRR